MAKKTTITTRQEIDGEELPEPENTPEPEVIDAGQQELADFFASLGTTANKIKIYKEVNGTMAYCGSAEPAIVTEDYLLRNYLAGKFTLKAVLNGRYVVGGCQTITLYEPPKDTAGNQRENPGLTNSTQFEILQNQIRLQHEMLMQVLQGGQSKQPTIAEIIGIVRDMQAMTKPADPLALITPLMGVFSDTMKMARESAGVSEGTNWMDLVGKAMDKIPAIVGQLAAGRQGAASPAPNVPETLSPEDQKMRLEMALKQGIAYLKAKAVAGKDPILQAEIILDNFDDAQTRALGVQIINMPFEDFGKFDNEILTEPLRTWFQKVYDTLKEGLADADSETKPDGGTDGSAADS